MSHHTKTIDLATNPVYYLGTMTTVEEKVHRYEKRQRGIELKRRLATLGDRLNDHAREWGKLSATFTKYADTSVKFSVESDQFGDREVRVQRPKADGLQHLPGRILPLETITVMSLAYLNPEGLAALLQEIEDTKQELTTIRKFCEEINDPLD